MIIQLLAPHAYDLTRRKDSEFLPRPTSTRQRPSAHSLSSSPRSVAYTRSLGQSARGLSTLTKSPTSPIPRSPIIAPSSDSALVPEVAKASRVCCPPFPFVSHPFPAFSSPSCTTSVRRCLHHPPSLGSSTRPSVYSREPTTFLAPSVTDSLVFAPSTVSLHLSLYPAVS